MMSGQIASYVSPGHDGKLFVSALFPLALWMLYRGIRGGKSWSWGAFALIIGLCVLSPHPQLLQYTAPRVRRLRALPGVRDTRRRDRCREPLRSSDSRPPLAPLSSDSRSAPCNTCRCAST